MKWSLLGLLLLTACPKAAPTAGAPASPAPPVEGPREPDERATPAEGSVAPAVRTADDLKGRAGQTVAVDGVLVRAPLPDGSGNGTAVQMGDGAKIWVSVAEPPKGWEWMLDSEVRVRGTYQEAGPGGERLPWLADPETPMPGGMSPSL